MSVARKRIPYGQHHLDVDDIQAVVDILENSFLTQGQTVEDFGKALADYAGSRYGIAVCNGTGALQLSVASLGLGPGDEVITTPMTFCATANAALYQGAEVRFVDIDSKTLNLNPELIESEITERTKAIIPVHLYGQPADMHPLIDMSHRYGLHIIEDAAQSHGAEYKGAKTGSIGVAASFSFYPAKNLGAYGDGGMVITSNPKINEKVRLLRDHGRTDKYTHIQIGFGERLDTIQAAILRVKLRHLDEWTEKRRLIAKLYNQYLGDTIAKLPSENPYSKHVYHLYVVRVPERDMVVNYLE